MADSLAGRIVRAGTIALQYGGIDGDHHKAWVIDQMVRALHGSVNGEATKSYKEFVKFACEGEDGPNTYEWNEGIAP